MNEREKKELALSKVVLLALAFIGVLVVVWLAWLHPSNNKQQTAINSFAACAKAGNPVQESYPEVCVTKDGKRFTNTNQHIQRITLREWDVDVLVSGVKDAYYTYDDTTRTVALSTKTLDAALDAINGCASGLREVKYERLQAGDPRADGGTWTAADLRAVAKQVGRYYYHIVPQIEVACVPDQDDPSVTTAQDIHTKLTSATFLP
ncbi:MAG TPA: hypothetical protein VD735_02560 [Candidatus Saccharimonadales bacterium]|nr:hypothetical protein [Candidatus Saccharimonadales bacterium]